MSLWVDLCEETVAWYEREGIKGAKLVKVQEERRAKAERQKKRNPRKPKPAPAPAPTPARAQAPIQAPTPIPAPVRRKHQIRVIRFYHATSHSGYYTWEGKNV